MFNNNSFIRLIARVVLAAFVYSFVAFEPLYGIATMDASAATVRAAVNEQLDTLVLSARMGHISDGCYVSPESGARSPERTTGGNSQLLRSSVSGLRTKNDRLIIFIQDLHCNAEVQKNINDILAFFDTKYGLQKIFVEGAPAGKTDLSLFTGITDPAIKEKTLESLLGEGLLSGAAYYGAKNNKENLYGLEQWDLYKENAARMSSLLSGKAASSMVYSRLTAMLEETKGLRCSTTFKIAEHKIKKDEKSADKYALLAKLADKNNISLLQYPNLKRQIAASGLSRHIKFKKLPADLQTFLKAMQAKLPYGVYKTLAEKLSDNARDGEFYLNLRQAASAYAPELLAGAARGSSLPNVENFLEYVRLNYSVNPHCLVNEENQFKQELLESSAQTLIDRNVLFMQSMTEKFKGFVNLGMTPADYTFFKAHVEEYTVTLLKYYGEQKTAAARALLENKELYAYYDVNLQRNDVFAKELLSVPSVKSVSSVKIINEYTEVIKHLSEFTEIDAVVTGGFHTETAKALSEHGISCITITPSVTRQTTGDLYERFMAGALSPQDLGISALAGRITVPDFVAGLGRAAIEQPGITLTAFIELLQKAADTFPGRVRVSHDGNNVTVTMLTDNNVRQSVTFTYKADGKFTTNAAEWAKSAATPGAFSLMKQSTEDYALENPFLLWLSQRFWGAGFAAVYVYASLRYAPLLEAVEFLHALMDPQAGRRFLEEHKGSNWFRIKSFLALSFILSPVFDAYTVTRSALGIDGKKAHLDSASLDPTTVLAAAVIITILVPVHFAYNFLVAFPNFFLKWFTGKGIAFTTDNGGVAAKENGALPAVLSGRLSGNDLASAGASLAALNAATRQKLLKRFGYIGPKDVHGVRRWLKDTAWLAARENIQAIDTDKMLSDLGNSGFVTAEQARQVGVLAENAAMRADIEKQLKAGKAVVAYGVEIRFDPVSQQFMFRSDRSLLRQFSQTPLQARAPPKVVVNVLVWNGFEETKQLLRSLAKVNTPNVEVVLLDNGSTDKQKIREFMDKEFSLDPPFTLTLLQSPVNLGFDEGHNVLVDYALDTARADNVIMLNSDIIVEENFYDGMLHPFEDGFSIDGKTANPGVVGPLVLNEAARKKHEKGEPIRPEEIITAGFDYDGAGRPATVQSSWSARRTDEVWGMAMAFPQLALREAGAWDPRFFAYGEEADLAQRLREANYDIIVTKDTKVWHGERSREGSLTSLLAIENGIKNSLLNYRKHPAPEEFVSRNAEAFGYFLKEGAKGFVKAEGLRKKLSYFAASVRGLAAGIAGKFSNAQADEISVIQNAVAPARVPAAADAAALAGNGVLTLPKAFDKEGVEVQKGTVQELIEEQGSWATRENWWDSLPAFTQARMIAMHERGEVFRYDDKGKIFVARHYPATDLDRTELQKGVDAMAQAMEVASVWAGCGASETVLLEVIARHIAEAASKKSSREAVKEYAASLPRRDANGTVIPHEKYLELVNTYAAEQKEKYRLLETDKVLTVDEIAQLIHDVRLDFRIKLRMPYPGWAEIAKVSMQAAWDLTHGVNAQLTLKKTLKKNATAGNKGLTYFLADKRAQQKLFDELLIQLGEAEKTLDVERALAIHDRLLAIPPQVLTLEQTELMVKKIIPEGFRLIRTGLISESSRAEAAGAGSAAPQGTIGLTKKIIVPNVSNEKKIPTKERAALFSQQRIQANIKLLQRQYRAALRKRNKVEAAIVLQKILDAGDKEAVAGLPSIAVDSDEAWDALALAELKAKGLIKEAGLKTYSVVKNWPTGTAFEPSAVLASSLVKEKVVISNDDALPTEERLSLDMGKREALYFSLLIYMKYMGIRRTDGSDNDRGFGNYLNRLAKAASEEQKINQPSEEAYKTAQVKFFIKHGVLVKTSRIGNDYRLVTNWYPQLDERARKLSPYLLDTDEAVKQAGYTYYGSKDPESANQQLTFPETEEQVQKDRGISPQDWKNKTPPLERNRLVSVHELPDFAAVVTEEDKIALVNRHKRPEVAGKLLRGVNLVMHCADAAVQIAEPLSLNDAIIAISMNVVENIRDSKPKWGVRLSRHMLQDALWKTIRENPERTFTPRELGILAAHIAWNMTHPDAKLTLQGENPGPDSPRTIQAIEALREQYLTAYNNEYFIEAEFLMVKILEKIQALKDRETYLRGLVPLPSVEAEVSTTKGWGEAAVKEFTAKGILVPTGNDEYSVVVDWPKGEVVLKGQGKTQALHRAAVAYTHEMTRLGLCGLGEDGYLKVPKGLKEFLEWLQAVQADGKTGGSRGGPANTQLNLPRVEDKTTGEIIQVGTEQELIDKLGRETVFAADDREILRMGAVHEHESSYEEDFLDRHYVTDPKIRALLKNGISLMNRSEMAARDIVNFNPLFAIDYEHISKLAIHLAKLINKDVPTNEIKVSVDDLYHAMKTTFFEDPWFNPDGSQADIFAALARIGTHIGFNLQNRLNGRAHVKLTLPKTDKVAEAANALEDAFVPLADVLAIDSNVDAHPADFSLLVGNPDMQSYIVFAQKWLERAKKGHRSRILISGGRGSGTLPLIASARRYLPPKILAKVEQMLTAAETDEGVKEADITYQVLVAMGLPEEKEFMRLERESLTTGEVLKNSKNILVDWAAESKISDPSIGIVCTGAREARAWATAHAEWADLINSRGWRILADPSKTVTKDSLHQLTPQELAMVCKDIVGIPEAAAKQLTLNITSEVDGLNPANNDNLEKIRTLADGGRDNWKRVFEKTQSVRTEAAPLLATARQALNTLMTALGDRVTYAQDPNNKTTCTITITDENAGSQLTIPEAAGRPGTIGEIKAEEVESRKEEQGFDVEKWWTGLGENEQKRLIGEHEKAYFDWVHAQKGNEDDYKIAREALVDLHNPTEKARPVLREGIDFVTDSMDEVKRVTVNILKFDIDTVALNIYRRLQATNPDPKAKLELKEIADLMRKSYAEAAKKGIQLSIKDLANIAAHAAWNLTHFDAQLTFGPSMSPTVEVKLPVLGDMFVPPGELQPVTIEAVGETTVNGDRVVRNLRYNDDWHMVVFKFKSGKFVPEAILEVPDNAGRYSLNGTRLAMQVPYLEKWKIGIFNAVNGRYVQEAELPEIGMSFITPDGSSAKIQNSDEIILSGDRLACRLLYNGKWHTVVFEQDVPGIWTATAELRDEGAPATDIYPQAEAVELLAFNGDLMIRKVTGKIDSKRMVQYIVSRRDPKGGWHDVSLLPGPRAGLKLGGELKTVDSITTDFVPMDGNRFAATVRYDDSFHTVVFEFDSHGRHRAIAAFPDFGAQAVVYGRELPVPVMIEGIAGMFFSGDNLVRSMKYKNRYHMAYNMLPAPVEAPSAAANPSYRVLLNSLVAIFGLGLLNSACQLAGHHTAVIASPVMLVIIILVLEELKHSRHRREADRLANETMDDVARRINTKPGFAEAPGEGNGSIEVINGKKKVAPTPEELSAIVDKLSGAKNKILFKGIGNKDGSKLPSLRLDGTVDAIIRQQGERIWNSLSDGDESTVWAHMDSLHRLAKIKEARAGRQVQVSADDAKIALGRGFWKRLDSDPWEQERLVAVHENPVVLSPKFVSWHKETNPGYEAELYKGWGRIKEIAQFAERFAEADFEDAIAEIAAEIAQKVLPEEYRADLEKSFVNNIIRIITTTKGEGKITALPALATMAAHAAQNRAWQLTGRPDLRLTLGENDQYNSNPEAKGNAVGSDTAESPVTDVNHLNTSPTSRVTVELFDTGLDQQEFSQFFNEDPAVATMFKTQFNLGREDVATVNVRSYSTVGQQREVFLVTLAPKKEPERRYQFIMKRSRLPYAGNQFLIAHETLTKVVNRKLGNDFVHLFDVGGHIVTTGPLQQGIVFTNCKEDRKAQAAVVRESVSIWHQLGGYFIYDIHHHQYLVDYDQNHDNPQAHLVDKGHFRLQEGVELNFQNMGGELEPRAGDKDLSVLGGWLQPVSEYNLLFSLRDGLNATPPTKQKTSAYVDPDMEMMALYQPFVFNDQALIQGIVEALGNEKAVDFFKAVLKENDVRPSRNKTVQELMGVVAQKYPELFKKLKKPEVSSINANSEEMSASPSEGLPNTGTVYRLLEGKEHKEIVNELSKNTFFHRAYNVLIGVRSDLDDLGRDMADEDTVYIAKKFEMIFANYKDPDFVEKNSEELSKYLGQVQGTLRKEMGMKDAYEKDPRVLVNLLAPLCMHETPVIDHGDVGFIVALSERFNFMPDQVAEQASLFESRKENSFAKCVLALFAIAQAQAGMREPGSARKLIGTELGATAIQALDANPALLAAEAVSPVKAAENSLPLVLNVVKTTALAVQNEIDVRNPAAQILGPLAQQGMVLLATKDTIEKMRGLAEKLAALGVHVTLITTAEAGAGMARAGWQAGAAQPLFAGGRLTAGVNTIYKGIKFSRTEYHKDGSAPLAIMTVASLDQRPLVFEGEGEDSDKALAERAAADAELLTLAAKAVADETVEGGVLERPFGNRKMWGLVADGTPALESSIDAVSHSLMANYQIDNWRDGDEVKRLLEQMVLGFKSQKKLLEEFPLVSYERQSRQVFMSSSVRVCTASLPGKNRTGRNADKVEFARWAAGKGANMLLCNDRLPGSEDPFSVDVLTVDLDRLVDRLFNEGVISRDKRSDLLQDLNPLSTDVTDRINLADQKILRKCMNTVAGELAVLCREKGIKVGAAVQADGEKLILALSRQQTRQAAAAMLTPHIELSGVIYGQDLGVIAKGHVPELIELLKEVPAVSFNSSALSSEEAAELFSAIADARAIAIRAGDRGLKEKIIITETSPQNALIAARFGIRAHVNAAKAGGADNLISQANAAIIVDNEDDARMVVKKGFSQLVAAFKGFNDDDGSLNRLSDATNKNEQGLLAILKAAMPGSHREIVTPEGRFNAGINEGNAYGNHMFGYKEGAALCLGLPGFAEAIKHLKGVLANANSTREDVDKALDALETIMASALTDEESDNKSDKRRMLSRLYAGIKASRAVAANDDHRLLGFQVYGVLTSFVGIAMLVGLDEGIVKSDIDSTGLIPITHLMTEVYINGLTPEKLKTDVAAVSPRAQGLRALLDSTANAATVTASISYQFERPTITIGDDPPRDYLTLAARAMLVLLKDSDRTDPKEVLGSATQADVDLFAEVLRAG